MLGTQIKKRRKDLNLTQAELAALSGVNQSTISDIENNVVKSPGVNLIHTICTKGLNCTVDDLMKTYPYNDEQSA